MLTELKYDAIRDFIQRNPGCHLRRIKKKLNISMGTVQYQLNQLEKNGIVTSSRRGFYRHYFPVAIKGFDKDILEILSHETLSQIILFVIEQKKPTQSEIAKEVGISHASIIWHMQRLIALNIVEEFKDGRYKRYRIIGNQDKWINLLAFMKNYYPSLWVKWSSRITEYFLCGFGMNLIDQIEIILIIATMCLSILLSALSISAYRNSRLKKMIYAAIAYSLFAIFSLSQYYEEFVIEGGNESHPSLVTDIGIHIIPLVILILFFIGIVKKEKYSNSLRHTSTSL